jgi:hypothetical protein
LFNFLLIALIVVALWLVKRFVRGERGKNITLFAAAVFTILFHYSLFLFKLVSGGEAMEYLSETPNLLLPIYPCNVVMWSALIFALLKDKKSKAGAFFADYLFWFGIVSTLVGMFANVDFIMNPTLRDFEIVKSIVAHATLLFNLLLIPAFGLLRPDFFRNMKNIVLSVLAMYAIGLYCNVIFEALVSAEAAYDVNSMFLIHSPFEGVPFLRYPLIAAIALVLYFIVFTVCDVIRTPRGARWFDRVRDTVKARKD